MFAICQGKMKKLFHLNVFYILSTYLEINVNFFIVGCPRRFVTVHTAAIIVLTIIVRLQSINQVLI